MMLKLFSVFLKGLIFGIIQIVPGISGGTIAVMLGFYERLIEAVSHFKKDWRRHLKFILPFLAGTALGLLIFSSVIRYLLINFSLPLMLFFTGMITGTVPLIYKKSKQPENKFTIKQIVLTVISAAVLIFIDTLRTPLPDSGGAPGPLMLYFAGLLAAAALIIPGISGSLVLLFMGVYPAVIDSVASVRQLPADFSLWFDIFTVLGPFGIGVLTGIALTARLIENLLNKHPKAVYSVILGFMMSSVYILINDPIVFQSGVSAAGITAGIIMFILGGILSVLTGVKKRKKLFRAD